MADEKRTILIIEDDLDVAEMLNAYFRVQGYEVQTANWGEDGVQAASDKHPDLIILDIRLPDIDGYEVAKRLRANRRTESVPIIFLTERRMRDDRLRGLELGADDYITKPFDIQELRLRVRNSLKRYAQGNLTNPITELPEGILVNEHLAHCLSLAEDTGFLIIKLLNLKNFREAYGFVASDDVLRAVSVMVQNSTKDTVGKNDFLGHLESDQFLLAVDPQILEPLRDQIYTRLSQSLDYFYPLKDRESGTFSGKRLEISIGTYILTATANISNVDALKSLLIQA